MNPASKKIISVFLQIAFVFLPVFASANAFSYHSYRQFLSQPNPAQGPTSQSNAEDQTKTTDKTTDASTPDQSENNQQKDASSEGKVEGSVTFIERAVGGFRQSAKFDEYRSIYPSATGGLRLDYQKRDGFYLNLGAQDLGLSDVRAGLNFGSYGNYKVEASFIGIPHNYAFDAKTLFTGVGTDVLSINGAIQNQLQSIMLAPPGVQPSQPQPPGCGPSPLVNCKATALTNDPYKNAMNALAGDVAASGQLVDIGLVRNRTALSIDIPAGSPFEVSASLNWERKQGTLPLSGYLGQDDDLGFIEELAQPVNYDTRNHNITFAYAKKPFYFSVAYNNSTFTDNIGNLFFDNPFRLTNAPPNCDVASPCGELETHPDLTLSGAAMGLIPLPPSNHYNAVALNGVIMDLPLHGKLMMHYTTGWAVDNSALPSYTSNSTLLQPANLQDYSALTPPAYTPIPCNDPACPPLPPPLLPATLNGKVHTSTLFARYTMQPFSFMHINAHYRSYVHDNSTPEYLLGKVVGDTAWDPTLFINAPYSFRHYATGVDVGIDLLKATTLTLSYESDETDKFNVEAGKYHEGKYEADLDTSPLPWLDFRASYQETGRQSNSDLTPTSMCFQWMGMGVSCDTPANNIPWLRRFDQANLYTDQAKYFLTANPIDELTFVASLDNGKNIYPDSNFGLLWQKNSGWGLNADYTPNSRFNFFVDYEEDHSNGRQQDRHWKPSGDNLNNVTQAGDPYTTEPGLYSPSNWTAENPEKATYFSAGFQYDIAPQLVKFSSNYSLSDEKGSVLYTSPLGSVAASAFKPYVPGYPTYVPGGSDQNFYLPLGLFNLDNTKLYRLDAHVDWQLRKDISTTFGWMWEKFYTDDFNNYGFTNTPYISKSATVTGALLMGTWPTSYNVNLIYVNLNYKF